jgi:hypothetical protein
MNCNNLIKRGGFEIPIEKIENNKEEIKAKRALEDTISPLSSDTDPRVKKLKKALQGLTITPPKKYIKIFSP